MNAKKRSPHDPVVHAEMLAFLRSMTPEELMKFMERRTPGVEETDMTGRFPINPPRPALTPESAPLKRTA